MPLGWTRRAVWACLFIAAVFGLTAGLAAAAPVSWGTAIEAPGTAALNTGGDAEITSVSCGGTGDCAAGGFYRDTSGFAHAFIQNAGGGNWVDAIPVSGTESATDSQLLTVSCPDSTYCGAGGYYLDADGYQHAFELEGSNGVWGSAVNVEGASGLHLGGNPAVNSISCRSVGNCTAGGNFIDDAPGGTGLQQAYVVDEKNGVWGGAIMIPGLKALNFSSASLYSVHCASAGNCVAAGSYGDVNSARQAFVAVEKAGVWRKAMKVAGNLNAGNNAEATTVSCGAAGYCSAGGSYTDVNGIRQPFLVTEKYGTWGKAIRVPGIAAVDTYGAVVNSVSCRGQSSCSAGGYYLDVNGYSQAFVVSEKMGTWGKELRVATTNLAHAQVTSVSCATAGNCAAVGYFYDPNGEEPFVVAQTGGTWGTSSEVPGAADLNVGQYAQGAVVSCAKVGAGCTIAGSYLDANGYRQAYITAP